MRISTKGNESSNISNKRFLKLIQNYLNALKFIIRIIFMLLFLPNKLLNKRNNIEYSILPNSLNKYPPLTVNPTISQFFISTHQPSHLIIWQDGAFSARIGRKTRKLRFDPFHARFRGKAARQKANYRVSPCSSSTHPLPLLYVALMFHSATRTGKVY